MDHSAQDRVQWRAFESKVMHFEFRVRLRISRTADKVSAVNKGICFLFLIVCVKTRGNNFQV
jgi:hypothetical protein